ncbi:Low-density lipoprotein receptor-related protein 1B [Camelus dromedarius]|uniref:Low-density lipoprotein receptor-related protein 1B n=1 Tax=Camelus dromedarius TaxID=9838 RepID=A0A5N4E5M0_CAMDR|nr:Low-density lipoprotein receptor-related protein 1B [Camelus dromedarius]
MPCIGKARLDGSEKVVLVSMGIAWPNGISIDYEENKLYWCDARTDKIERIDLETGGNREVVLSGSNVDMFSVAVFGAYIYWSDRAHANGSIRRGHKNDATETVTMRTGLGVNLKEVKIFNRGPMFVPRTMGDVSNSVFIEEMPGELVLVPMDIWQRMELLA